jgi:hypothetical protein
MCNCLIQFLLYGRSRTALPTPCISAQRLSERALLLSFAVNLLPVFLLRLTNFPLNRLLHFRWPNILLVFYVTFSSYLYIIIIITIISGTAAQRGLWLPRHTRFLDHTQRRATVSSTPL